MSSIKDTLKNCKSVKNSDEILDELFSSIKEEKKSSDDEEDESDNEGSDESSEDDRKKHKKSKKKKKKHKKKKKKHKRSEDHSEERDVKPSKKIKKEKSDKDRSDSFWGDGNKPFEISESKVSNGHGEVVKRERSEKRYTYDESERREKYERREKEYNDERKPVDLGREARPYPTGLSSSSSSHRDRDDYYERGSRRVDGYSREPYDRERWERRQYDRYDDRERDRYYDREPRDRRPYDRDDRRGYERESRPREEYHRMKEKARESYKSVKETTESKKKKSRSRSKEETNGEGGGGDSFWDSKWEGMQLDEKLRKAEHKGRYYLNTEKRYQDTMGDKARDDSVSLSPSPERVDKSKEVTSKKKGSDSESDTEEFKRLKEMKKVQNFVVKGDGMVEGPIADTSNFEYDPVTRMYKKKDGLVELETRRNYKDEEKKKEDDKWKSDDELEREKKENEKTDSNKDEAKKEETKKEVDKDEIMDELVKEIEELENEVDADQEKKPDTGGIDWGSSALEEIITEKEKEERKKKKEEEKQKKKEEKELKKALEEEVKKFRKSEDGEISDGVEDGEVSSGDERKRTKYTRASKRSRSRSRTRRRSYSRGRESRDRYSSSRSYRRRSRSFSRDRYSSRRRSPYDRERDRDYRDGYPRRRYSRSRSRTRSRSRSRERRARAAEERYERMRRKQERHLRSKINKEKLLEIAKKNANKILKSGGDFMGMDQDRLVAMKAGGSSLDELTKFCKELAKKGLADGDRIDMLAESESDSEEEFHHPFMVKDKPLPNPITMMIGEQKETLTPTARAVAKSQRMLEFPVSSGNAHRTKADGTTDGIGEWEPVQTSNTLSELARPALVAPIDIKDDDDEMLKFHEQMEQEEKDLREEAAKTLWTLNEEDKDITVPKGKDFFKPADVEVVLDEKQLAEIERLKPKPSKLAEVLTKTAAPLALPAPKLTTPLDVTEPEVSKDPNKVFDTVKAPVVDIGTIVSRRLNAMRKLQANPSDAEALAEMYDAQQMMSDWAGSKNKPGQFVGSTGARVLSKGELNLGLQCWAKADQFHKAEKVKGGFGEFMLKKMGWKDGEGLGRFKSGEVNPLTLDIKFDKKGLMAAEETKKGREVVTMTACKDLSGKHPVSALTELCSKRRWGPPIFTQAFECGPPHKKQYVYKVNVNGADYMPTVAVDNKKKAKANAAMACLQQMGLVPKDPDNPV